ncbi:integrase [Gordonia phage William]|uniref:Serine integrase n=1 Tax=Gordonia phage William TaxID=2571253 RepID=A0A4Y6EGI8_9CAUD|nr:integrase [Gordonia phage William]QDF17135.1 serine integrase [Gordonia phage William]
MRAIIYCRVSSDPKMRERSVQEQEIDCRAVASANGWDVGEVLIDNDRGASRYSRGDRPAYRRLAEILQPGDVLVTWEASRAQRDLGAYLQLRTLCEQRGVPWSYAGKLHDLTRGDDRFVTGLDALLSEKEVEQTRERVLRSVRANAAAGRPHGKLPYGYMIVRDPDTGQPVDRVPNPDTAPIVREIVTRVLAGDSLYSLCRELNERGVPGPRPKRDGSKSQWIPVTMRKIIESPTYAGLRTHQGQIVGPATWEPLVTMDEHERVKGLLADPRRLTQRGSEPRWLLSGIVRCGVCGSKMNRLKNRGCDSYVCKNGSHTSRKIETIDAYVTEAVIRRLEGQELVGQIDDDDAEYAAAVEAVRALQQRLDAFADSAADGELSPAALARVESRLRPQLEAAEARMRALVQSPVVAQMAGDGARERWERLDLHSRRELIRALVDIRIHQVGIGRRGLIGEGVEFTWL